MSKLVQWVKKYVHNISIANKITLMYGGLFSLSFVVFTIFVMLNASYLFLKNAKIELEETATAVSKYIVSDSAVTQEALEGLSPNRDVIIRVINVTKGSQISSTSKYEPPREGGTVIQIKMPDPPNEMMNSLASIQIWTEQIKSTSNKGFRALFTEKIVEHKGQTYLVHVFRSDEKELKISATYRTAFVLFNLGAIIVAFIIGKYISKKMLKPIIELTNAAERISIEDLTRRISVPETDDEIKRLAVTFNDMIGRLQQSFEKQTQFVEDASHELKTPIAVIQGYANLVDRWGKKDVNVLQESIDSIKAEAEHMASLVKKLLFLARNDNSVQLTISPINLGLLCEEILKEAGLRAVEQRVIVQKDSEEIILGDLDLIKQMIWIFMDNAIKYSEPSSQILLKIYGEGGKSFLSVKDFGIGMSTEDAERVFERFYRVDKSRSKKIPGTGLGLSIADHIANRHKAKIWIQSDIGKGTEIIVEFTRGIGGV